MAPKKVKAMRAMQMIGAEVRDYQNGEKQSQTPQAGGQKSSSRKVREDDPFGSGKRLVLVYSLGDEMYKWANPGAIFHPFSKYLDLEENGKDQKLKYKFPTGWGGKTESFKHHLIKYNKNGFNGERAFQEALQWKGLQKAEKERERQHQRAQMEYRAFHSRPVASPVRSVSFAPTRSFTPFSSRAHSPSPKRQKLDSGALRGVMVPAGHTLEEANADDRYSTDERRRAEAILGVKQGASVAEIRRAFRLKAFRCHPDKQPPHLKQWGHEEMSRLSAAYDLLTKTKGSASDTTWEILELEDE